MHTIAFVMNGAKPPRTGGVFVRMLRDLNRDLFRPVLIYAEEDPTVVHARSLGVQLHRLSIDPLLTSMYIREESLLHPRVLARVPRVLLRSRVVPALAEILEREGADVVFCWDNLSKIVGGLAASRLGIPAVATSYDVLEPSLHGLAMRLVNGLAVRRLYAASKAVHQSLLRSRLTASKSVVIYCGIDLDRFDPSHVQPVEMPAGHVPGAVVIGCVGALEENKGQEILLRAASLLARDISGPPIAVWLAGQGPAEADLRRLARELGIEDIVRFWGYFADMPALLRAMDIIAMPSRWVESLGLAVVEAMAMQVPAVGTPIGGLPEVIEDGETGLLVPPSDVTSLAEALRLLIADPARRRRMGEKGRLRAEALFSAEAARDALERELLSVIRGVTPRRGLHASAAHG